MTTPCFVFSFSSRAKNRYDNLTTPLGTYRGSSQYIEMCLGFILFHMLDLSVFVYFCDLFMASFYSVLIIVVSFMIQIMNEIGKGLFIPSHTFTCIFMT